MISSCKIKKITALITIILTLFTVSAYGAAKKKKPKKEPEPAALRNWAHEIEVTDRDDSQSMKLKITYYSNEYVENLIAAEAEKNMWTNDEVENYKYTLLKNLNLAECIPFHVDMYIRGMPIYPGPFDKHITMIVGGKKYTPIDYDKRFNFKLLGGRDGMVFFPRYDPKTGKAILDGAKDVRILFDSSICFALSSTRGDLLWVWDLNRDRGSITGGRAANRLEIDRLLKRTEKLNEEKRKLQEQIAALDKESSEVNSRIDELQSN